MATVSGAAVAEPAAIRAPTTAATRTFLFNMFEKLLSLGFVVCIQQHHWTPHAARMHVPAPALMPRAYSGTLNHPLAPYLRMHLTVRSPQCRRTIGWG
ncbi:hypothetical protein STPYR_11993 [uncultured Stenotrophomonas sp.]|uniref:Uncharacterized protein n=1 Tax=uncultured Stenotrophomonas sp. TaxID=165438 RepID=A0A1Y5Q4B8_9GAMM|nr:hypothetical protein STPYR_11993 [uncultured Stenotrophomonas sp.]